MNLQQKQQELLAAKDEIEERLKRTHKHLYEKAEPVSANFHEQVTETSNDALVFKLERDGRAELSQINRALLRLEEGEYLHCSACGKLIGDQRLAAIPFTEFCVDCATADPAFS